MSKALAQVLAEGKGGTARDRPKEAGVQSYEPTNKESRASTCQRTVSSHSLPDYGPVISVNRPVRTRMPGGVGAGGENPPATRLALLILNLLQSSLGCIFV
jgi:hypothetical protein